MFNIIHEVWVIKADFVNLILSESNLDWSYIREWAKRLGVVDLLDEVGAEDV